MIIDISRTSPISRIFRYPVETNVPSNFFPMCIITARSQFGYLEKAAATIS